MRYFHSWSGYTDSYFSRLLRKELPEKPQIKGLL